MSEKKSERTPLKLRGELTILRAADIKDMIAKALEDTDSLRIDTTEAQSCDVSFLQIVAAARGRKNKRVWLHAGETVAAMARESGLEFLLEEPAKD